MPEQLVSVDSRNAYEDLSGIVIQPGQNPYQVFIEACHDNHAEIRALYEAHRLKRNAQQKEKFLSSDFKELVIDQYLLRIENPLVQPGFEDERNCFTFWARPPEHILLLAGKIQQMLRKASPNLWLMPSYKMHMTTLELAFSKTPQEIGEMVDTIKPAVAAITSYTRHNRSRLVRPLVSYDLSAFAVSFLPASGDPKLSPAPTAPDAQDGVREGDDYTYHHLRRDVFNMTNEAGIQVGSRYQVPSAHITLGRYLTEDDHDTPEKRAAWVQAIDDVNTWLMTEVWDKEGAEFIGEWVVGQERGLDARNGTLWYGGGRSILVGEGF